MSNAFQKVYDQINQTNLINQRLMEAELIFGGLQGFDCAHCYFTRLNLKKWSLSNFAFQHCKKLTKIIFEILWGILEIIQFILSDKHLDGACRSLGHFLDKVRKWHFHSTSNEVI